MATRVAMAQKDQKGAPKALIHTRGRRKAPLRLEDLGIRPCKIFVGSLPDGCPEDLVRQEFSKYGRITDVYMKQGCEPGRQWAFVIYSSAEEAKMAKESTDKILELPGSTKPCEVMLAKNQGMYGQAPLRDFHHGGGGMAGQPPPPSTPPPPHLTPWRSRIPWRIAMDDGQTPGDPT
eukprot:Skav223343  [mRNA]  locus=scaffold200:302007:305852:+ [translate_table: standard]